MVEGYREVFFVDKVDLGFWVGEAYRWESLLGEE